MLRVAATIDSLTLDDIDYLCQLLVHTYPNVTHQAEYLALIDPNSIGYFNHTMRAQVIASVKQRQLLPPPSFPTLARLSLTDQLYVTSLLQRSTQSYLGHISFPLIINTCCFDSPSPRYRLFRLL